MQPRFNFAKAAPDAYKAVAALEQYVQSSGLERRFIHLIKLRASQINGCAYCVDMTRIGTSFGAVTLAANAVLMNFVLLSSYYLDGLANAAEQITGRAIGARYRPAFDRGLKLTILWSFGLAAIVSAFFFLAGPWLISVLTTSPEVRQAAATYLPWAAVTGLTGALAFLMDGVFIGATCEGEVMAKVLLRQSPRSIELMSLNPEHPNRTLELSDVDWIARIIWASQ